MSMLTVLDLFCGAGGLSLGFQAAGCRILAAVDVDETAAQTFSENFARLQPDAPPAVFTGDEGNIENLDIERLTRGNPPDILIGGPPCQGFSRLGRAKLDSLSDEGFAGDPRNTLYRRFLDAAEISKPRAVLMENVPGMLSVAGRNVANDVADDLARRGYRVGYAVLNSVWYGVPQFRERLFFVGLRADLEVEPVMPPATHATPLPQGYQQPKAQLMLPLPLMQHHELPVEVKKAAIPAVTVADALDDLPLLTGHLSDESPLPRGDFRNSLAYRCAPHSRYAHLMRSWPGFPQTETVVDHSIRRTPRDYETFRRMNHGDRYPAALQIARERRDEELRRLGDTAPLADSAEYRELERRFIPPYPEDIFIDKWRKLIPDQPAWTVPAHLSKDAYSHIHHDSEQARAISIRDAARLQSFPDAFLFSGNMGDCFRQVGNAVPPLVAWALATQLVALLSL